MNTNTATHVVDYSLKYFVYMYYVSNFVFVVAMRVQNTLCQQLWS